MNALADLIWMGFEWVEKQFHFFFGSLVALGVAIVITQFCK